MTSKGKVDYSSIKDKALRIPLVPENWGHGRPWGGAPSHLLTFFPDDPDAPVIPTSTEKRIVRRCKFWDKFLTQKATILSSRSSEGHRPSVVAFIGVPMDIGVGYRHGTRFGPRAIREASAQFGSGVESGYDISEIGIKIVDLGDVDIHPYLLSEKLFDTRILSQVRDAYRKDAADVPPLGKGNLERIQYVVKWVLGAEVKSDEPGAILIPQIKPTWKENVLPVVMGGDHSITLPCVRAVKEVYGKEGLGIIYFDAHPDYLERRSGLEETHASQAKRVADEIGGEHLFQIGIRYLEPEEIEGLKRDSVHYWPMARMANFTSEAFADDILFPLLREERINNLYISIDIDVLDAGIVPGTGVPEPGGMQTRYLLDVLQRLLRKVSMTPGMKLVAFDIVEVAPDWDIGNTAALAAVKIIFESMGAYFISEKKIKKIGLI